MKKIISHRMFEDPKHLFEYNVNSLHSNNSNIELMHFSSLKGFHLQEFFSLCFLHIKTSFLIASTRYKLLYILSNHNNIAIYEHRIQD